MKKDFKYTVEVKVIHGYVASVEKGVKDWHCREIGL